MEEIDWSQHMSDAELDAAIARIAAGQAGSVRREEPQIRAALAHSLAKAHGAGDGCDDLAAYTSVVAAAASAQALRWVLGEAEFIYTDLLGGDDTVRLAPLDTGDRNLIVTALGLLLHEALRTPGRDIADGYGTDPAEIRALMAKVSGRAPEPPAEAEDGR
jgi:hypothetical protein